MQEFVDENLGLLLFADRVEVLGQHLDHVLRAHAEGPLPDRGQLPDTRIGA